MGDSHQEGSPLTGGGHDLSPLGIPPFGTVLEFVLVSFSAGLTHSTQKVYVAAIAAYHTPFGGLSIGKNPLVTRFLRCTEAQASGQRSLC